ncbi:MAG: hypothetical protein R2708_18990 [Vicinamibacterales bacterium]
MTTAMEQGAAGVSTNLIYPPNAFATLDELIAVPACGRRWAAYASHLRHDGKKLRDGIGEAIAYRRGRERFPCTCFTSRSGPKPTSGA